MRRAYAYAGGKVIMKWIIEVEETVTMHHQIVVDINEDSDLNRALDNTDEMCNSLDDFVSSIADVIPVLEVNEEFLVETQHIEYFDDYEPDY